MTKAISLHRVIVTSFFITLSFSLQNALNAQRVAGLVKTAETMGILDTSTESTKQSDIDEILGFLAALEKVRLPCFQYHPAWDVLFDSFSHLFTVDLTDASH